MSAAPALLTAIVACVALAAPAGATEFVKELAFARGKTSAAVSGSAVRGDRDIYLVRARAGQVMSVKAAAPEDNVAFSIYEPGATAPVAGTEEEHDLAAWRGTLRKSGAYRIVVGGTRGNADYKLSVSVK